MSPLPPALVLAAGLGTRLRPLTTVRAKPALPVAGIPLICRILGWLGREGVPEAIVNLHHLPESVTGVLGDGLELGVRVRYSWEQPLVLGSAGGPRQALDIIGRETFFIVNGDTMTDVALAPLASDHARHGALVTMALVPNDQPQKYGGITLDASGAITGFVRRGDGAIGSYHFVGVQIAQREVFAPLAAGEPVSSVGGRYDALIREQPGALRGFVTTAAFCDIGTVSDYWRTAEALDPSGTGGVAASVQIAAGARVARSIVWDDVRVGAGAVVERCIVTDGVIVPAGAHFRGSILINGDGNRITVVSLPEDCQ